MILRLLRLFRAFREAELDRDEARASAARGVQVGMEVSAAHRHLEIQFKAEIATLRTDWMAAEGRADVCESRHNAAAVVLAETQTECDGLQRQLEVASGAKIEAQDRVRDLEATVTRLTENVAAANEKESYSVKCVADWLAMARFGVPIYGVAPQIPEGRNTDADLIPRAGMQGRALAQQLEDEFFSRQ